MYILDTDRFSILDRGGAASQHLLQRLATENLARVAATIISYEEQLRGWLSYIAKNQALDRQVEAYSQLKQQLMNYCKIPILEFDARAA